MIQIGIIGASSQVGSSLAYYLSKYPNIRLTCFIRSAYSEIFFDVLRIPCIKIEMEDPVLLKDQLKNFDAIIDCGFPTGQLFSIKKMALSSIRQVISCMPAGATYFYMSSIMAYGMLPGKYLKKYVISRSWYASVKRSTEKAAVEYGRKYSIKVYSFRLGQVHGILQSSNAAFREQLGERAFIHIDGEPGELTNTIFVHSIASAIMECMNGTYKSETYTLVSNPQWTLKELYEYYLNYYRLPTKLIYAPKKKYKRQWKILKNPFNGLKQYRHLFDIYFGLNFPGVSSKIKGMYLENQVAGIIHKDGSADNYVPTNLLGSAGPEIFPLEPSPVELVSSLEQSFENYYTELIKKQRS